jgi:hypothetical protein
MDPWYVYKIKQCSAKSDDRGLVRAMQGVCPFSLPPHSLLVVPACVLLGKDDDWGLMRAYKHTAALFKSAALLLRAALKPAYLYQTIKNQTSPGL